MQKPKPFHGYLLIAVILFMSLGIVGFSGAMGRRSAVEQRPDLIVIDIPAVEGRDKMAAVTFLHGPHAEAVKGDCSVCHMTGADRPVFKFKRLAEADETNRMDLYHDECTACHKERKEKHLATGPDAGQCRACHHTRPKAEAGQQPVKFDRSLHFRHERSDEIKPSAAGEAVNCGACHHQYNPKTFEIYYEKGREGACVYCHKTPPAERIRSARQAAHDSCVACHRALRKKDIAAGPVTCAACHALGAFKDIEPLTDVPRVNRDQPDALFISGWGGMHLTAAEAAGLEKRFMKPVPFDHRAHEGGVASCKICHHESLDKCGKCHTPEGTEKGGYIRLDQTMHEKNSDHSCLGCHGRRKTERPECAGCHFPMAEKAFADQSCGKCHVSDIPAAALVALEASEQRGMVHSALDGLIDRFRPVADEKIPETVTIDAIAETYEPSRFPHRKIVKSIMEKIEDSDMARVFHGDGLTICRGCHHNSPASLAPPACASCHGQPAFARDGRPGLKGAYHGQCITCHQKMNIEAVAATDCTKCHQEKSP